MGMHLPLLIILRNALLHCNSHIADFGVAPVGLEKIFSEILHSRSQALDKVSKLPYIIYNGMRILHYHRFWKY